jgi:hypothetical protein
MLRRISLVFLLLFSITAHADLNYQNYAAGGAMPSYTQDSSGNITNRTLLSTGTVNIVGLTTSSGAGLPTRSDGFIVRFYGFINIPTAGTYYFGGQADDGIRIKINNISVVDSWIESGGAFREGSINLSAGVVPVEVMFYENGGGQMVNFQWFMNGYWQTVPSTSTATTSTYFAPPAPVYSSGITIPQQTRKNSETTQRTNQSGNEINIDQIGDNNSITIRQGVSATGKNRIELYSNGSSNTYNLNQGYLTDGTVVGGDSSNHYLYLNVTGSNNTITKQQSGTTNFNETTVSGNTNNLTNIQQGNSPKILFQNINGNSNTVTTNQKDTGTHYLDINLTGAGHNVNAIQEGTGNHAATIQFTNSGGASSLNLNQSGATNQTYSIQQSCTNPAGCSATVTQP